MMHQRSLSQRSGFFRNGPVSPIAQRHQRQPSTDEGWDMGDDIGSEAAAYEGDDSRALALQDDNLQSDTTMEFYKPELHRFALHLDEATRDVDTENPAIGLQLLERFLEYSESKQSELASQIDPDTTIEDEQEAEALDLESNYWRMEFQTWELLAVLLHPREHEESLEDISQNRFCSNLRLKQQMIQKEPKFEELTRILEWLHRHAPDAVDESGEATQGAGGWVYTKQKIKGDKRVRPGKQLSLFPSGMGNSFGLKPRVRDVVTELDPDAPTRQGKQLEEEDELKERALMRLVWMHLRKGELERAQQICEDAGEWWRAASLSGYQDAWDPNVDSVDEDDMIDSESGIYPVDGNRRRELWKRMCYALASRKQVELFERAVYGTLCGDLESVVPVCDTWEDHLFAHINSLVEGAYSSSLASMGRVAPAVLGFPTFDTVAYHSRKTTLWDDQTILPRIVDSIAAIDHLEESKLPLRVIQGSLISDRFKSLVTELNEQLAIYQANPDFQPIEVEGRTLDVCDCRLLRFVVHVILIMQILGMAFNAGTPEHEAAENVIGAYLQLLVEASEYELLPLYASRLSPAKAIETVGNALVGLTGEERREEVLRLMQMQNIDIDGCLRKAMDVTLGMTEETYENLRVSSGEGIVAKRFSGDLDEADRLLVSSLEWLVLGGPSLRGDLVRLGVECYKRFMFTGRLSGAKQLFEKVSSQNVIPSQDVHGYIGDDVDMMDELSSGLDDDSQLAAAVYIQFENMVGAIIALDDWRNALPKKLDRIDRKVKDQLRTLFQVATDRLLDVIQNLFSIPEVLAVAGIPQIRNLYIPELVLALHQTYVEAGKVLSKQWLMSTMDLAVIVADPENTILESFKESGRIEEYVDCLAQASRDMLGVAQEGGRGPAAQLASIWSVS